MRWIERYHLATPAQRKGILEEGVGLAKERRKAIAKLIVEDPELALRKAVPRGSRAGLPKEVLDEIERPVDAFGTLALVIACSHGPEEHERIQVDHASAQAGKVPDHGVWRDAVVDGDVYRAFVYGRREQMLTLENVPLTGIVLDSHMAVDASPTRRVGPGEPDFRQDVVTLQVGGVNHTFVSEAEAEAFNNLLLEAEDHAGGPRVSYSPSVQIPR